MSEYDSDAIDKERTCLLGGQAGRSLIDRVIGLSIERKGLFNHLTLESIGLIPTENVDLTVMEYLLCR